MRTTVQQVCASASYREPVHPFWGLTVLFSCVLQTLDAGRNMDVINRRIPPGIGREPLITAGYSSLNRTPRGGGKFTTSGTGPQSSGEGLWVIDDDNRSFWSLSPEEYAPAQRNTLDARKKGRFGYLSPESMAEATPTRW